MKRLMFMSMVAAGVFAPLLSVGGAGMRASIECEGVYPYHPQGVATDGTNIYWSFTTVIAKTDLEGRVLARFEGCGDWSGHIGDLCCHGGKLYASINRGFRRGLRVGDEVWTFDGDLKPVARHSTREMVWCNNGLAWANGSFWLVTSAPTHGIYNYLYEYAEDFRFKRCVTLASGWTNLGVQTILAHDGKLLLGCYGASKDEVSPHPDTVLVVDLEELGPCTPNDHAAPVRCAARLPLSAACGMLTLDGAFMTLRSVRLPDLEPKRQRWTARLVPQELVRP